MNSTLPKEVSKRLKKPTSNWGLRGGSGRLGPCASVYLVLRNIIGMQSELDGNDNDHTHTTTPNQVLFVAVYSIFLYAFLRPKRRENPVKLLAFSRQLMRLPNCHFLHWYILFILIIDVTCYLTTEISSPLLTGYILQSAIFRLTI